MLLSVIRKWKYDVLHLNVIYLYSYVIVHIFSLIYILWQITNTCVTKKLSTVKCATKWKRLGIPDLEQRSRIYGTVSMSFISLHGVVVGHGDNFILTATGTSSLNWRTDCKLIRVIWPLFLILWRKMVWLYHCVWECVCLPTVWTSEQVFIKFENRRAL
jgi:hypothetical protein